MSEKGSSLLETAGTSASLVPDHNPAPWVESMQESVHQLPPLGGGLTEVGCWDIVLKACTCTMFHGERILRLGRDVRFSLLRGTPMTIPASPPTKKQIGRLTLQILAIVLLVAGARWLTGERKPLPESAPALDSDNLVGVTQEPWLAFAPTQSTPDTGFIFYPGGRIDPRGYALLMKSIASKGYLVVVPEMPLNIAAFRPNIADEIMAYFPDISRWVIGGHSVGGTMAAQYASANGESVDGLAIWASYPADNADLSGSGMPVALIYGSLDPRVNDSSVAEREHLLPDDTSYTRIDGGDHHQFGSYEIDPEDHHATIDAMSQQQQIIEATLRLLESIPQPIGD